MAEKEVDIKAAMEKMHLKKDRRKVILLICVIGAIVMFILGGLNATEQMNLSVKPFTTPKDTNADGVVDKYDNNPGYDSNGDGIPDQSEYPMQRMLNFMTFALIILCGPYGFYVSAKDKELKEIEKRLPDFLRDVAEAGRFGMTLAESVVVASSGRYGRLTPEIKKMAAQIQWGVPAAQALSLFAKRIKTSSVERVVAIITKASEAGGNVADVLTMVSHNAKEARLVEEEREIAMQTYLVVILISFFVFLVTIWILNATFLPKMIEASTAITAASGTPGAGGGAATSGALASGSVLSTTLKEDVQQIQMAFFVAAIVHAVGDGILAGVLANGKIANGMKWAFIMLIIGFLILQFAA